MSVVLILQARLGSTRLPGKVLADIQGMPMLCFQHKRLESSNLVDNIVVATTDNIVDDAIVDLCIKENFLFYRGSEKNVLKRYFDAANDIKASHVVRCNADCPLIDSEIVDLTISEYLNKLPKYDYASTILDQTYPLGMHVEIFSYLALKEAFKNAVREEDFEHVTPYIYNNPSKFNLLSIKNSEDLSKYRWTVDYKKDLIMIRNFVRIIGISKALKIRMNEIVKILNTNEDICKINQKYKKNVNIKYKNLL